MALTTRTAIKNINENNYNIYQTQDQTGVLVSIISTKNPFKGTNIFGIVAGDKVEAYFP